MTMTCGREASSFTPTLLERLRRQTTRLAKVAHSITGSRQYGVSEEAVALLTPVARTVKGVDERLVSRHHARGDDERGGKRGCDDGKCGKDALAVELPVDTDGQTVACHLAQHRQVETRQRDVDGDIDDDLGQDPPPIHHHK